MTAIEFHPLANLFPLIEGADFDALVEDIGAHGLREPITLYQGQILDGRNRYRACEETSVEPKFEHYTGSDPVGFVVSLNLRRRHLNESQRAMVAARLATLKQGARTDLSPTGEMSQAQAANLLNVGKRSVERAAEVRDHGTQGLLKAVDGGELSVTAAADIATLPEAEQIERSSPVGNVKFFARQQKYEQQGPNFGMPSGRPSWWRYQQATRPCLRTVDIQSSTRIRLGNIRTEPSLPPVASLTTIP